MQVTRFGNLASLALLCGAGIIAIAMALKLGVWRDGSPGPGLFPFLASVGIVSLSAIGMATAAWRLRQVAGQGDTAAGLNRQGLLRVAVYTAALLGYALLLETLGFYVTTVLVLFVILKLAERLSWRIVVPVILGALVFTYLLFQRALGVYFAKGSVWESLW